MSSRKLTEIERWERYWSKVKKTDTCWLWSGSTNSCGYGNVYFCGRVCGAHRVMLVWMGILKHPIHSGDRARNIVLHSCDNKLCVNPAHSSLGTNSQNQRDAYARKLRAPYKGATHTNAKLTDDQVREIRAAYQQKEMSQVALAKKYGVSQRAISLVVRQETYTCVS